MEGVGTGNVLTDFNDISSWDFKADEGLPDSVLGKVGFVIALLRNLSIVATVIIITILGIKYMLASVQEKADYKKTFINIIIGAVMISGITSIVGAIFSMTQAV